MSTNAQIQAFIDSIPEGEENGVTAKMIKDALQSLKDREFFSGNYNDLDNLPQLFSKDYNDLVNQPQLFSEDYNDLDNLPDLFSKEYADLNNIPTTILHANHQRARIYRFSEPEEDLKQNATVWHSGAQILANNNSSMNIKINPLELGRGFETFIDQTGDGPLIFVNMEPSTYDIILPEGKLAQTENLMDSVSILIWDSFIYIKGDLKDA